MAGRGRVALMSIVDENQFLNDAAILEEHHTLGRLGIEFQTKLAILEWAAKRKLVKNTNSCNNYCNSEMTLIKKTVSTDGYQWKCKHCEKKISVRDGSFFARSHLGIDQIIIIMYCWARDLPQQDAAHEAELGTVSTHSIVDWNSFCRDICERNLEEHPMQIGGLDEETLEPKTVEIDESKYFHRKYHRGQWREGHWVFGGIERGTGKCFLVEVPNRTADTLAALILRYILPGTIIVSDGWRAYRQIAQLGGGIYDHQVIIHEENFVHPDNNDIHTQNIENTWMRAKRKLKRQFGTSEALFPSYLHEFMWRNKFAKENMFPNFILCVRAQYDLQQ